MQPKGLRQRVDKAFVQGVMGTKLGLGSEKTQDHTLAVEL